MGLTESMSDTREDTGPTRKKSIPGPLMKCTAHFDLLTSKPCDGSETFFPQHEWGAHFA
jgi:hypothetical protein